MKKKSKVTLAVEIPLYIFALIIAAGGVGLIGGMYIYFLFREWTTAALIAMVLVMLPAILFWGQGIFRFSKRIGFNMARLIQ